MTTKIEDLQKHISKSRTIRQEITGFMREALQEYRGHASQINTDPRLSAQGRADETGRLREHHERKVLELAKGFQDEESKALDAAKSGARKILAGDLPKVAAQKRRLFEREAEQLKAQVMFATSTNDMMTAIKDLANAADEPGLAAEVKPEIMRLSEKVLNQADPGETVQLKKTLSQVYEDISDAALPEGGREARDILGTAEAIENTPMLDGIVPEAMQEITQNTSRYINEPEKYLNAQEQDGQQQQQGGSE